MRLPPWINEEFTAENLPAGQMDALWGSGWRRFGQTLFRYSLTLDASGGIDTIIPLRVPLDTFVATKSQRRILRRNSDLTWDIRPASLSPEICELFERHRRRFRDNVPESLAVFLGQDPPAAPCRCLEFRASLGNRLLAASFLDVGEHSVSSVYGIFDPAEPAAALEFSPCSGKSNGPGPKECGTTIPAMPPPAPAFTNTSCSSGRSRVTTGPRRRGFP